MDPLAAAAVSELAELQVELGQVAAECGAADFED